MKVTQLTIATLLGLLADNAFAAPTVEVSTATPFNSCLTSGKSWEACRQMTAVYAGSTTTTKRDVSSASPFHDCLATGQSWNTCRSSVHELTYNSQDLKARSDMSMDPEDTYIYQRDAQSDIDEMTKDFRGKAKCYLVDNLGAVAWLTNTKVRKLKEEACGTAVTKAMALGSSGIGTFATTASGFYQANAGPVIANGVHFFLSVYYEDVVAPVEDALRTKLVDLCIKGVENLLETPKCTAARKVGVITSHTSVNGGQYAWGGGGAEPNIDASNGQCDNCVLSLSLEAANKVNIDGVIVDTAN